VPCGNRATVEDAARVLPYWVYPAWLDCLTPDLAPYCVPRFPGLLFVSASVGALFAARRLLAGRSVPNLDHKAERMGQKA
jgi:hypothetical protein